MAEQGLALKRALILDDEAEVRAATGLLFNALYGCEITEARSGPEALDLLGREHFDLVITDFLMPEMDGITFAIQVRSRFPAIPMLMITAFPADVTKPGNPVEAILPKPFRVPELKAAVERALSRDKAA